MTAGPRILINLSTLKVGGGQTVGLNFLTGLLNNGYDITQYHFLVAKGSAAHRFLTSQGAPHVFATSRAPLLRILQEIFPVSLWIWRQRIDVIYTMFGYGMFLTRRPQVCGSAVSNIYYPEIDFWQGHTFLERCKRYLIDRYRSWSMHRAAAVVFENEDMFRKAERLYRYKRSKLILPSANLPGVMAGEAQQPRRTPRAARGLFLCGWQLNKNVMLIPELAAAFRKRGRDFEIILTAPQDGSRIHQAFMAKAEALDVADRIQVVGQVDRSQLADLYESVDVVFLLSRLESFSNNIIEAWHFARPLVISDEPWARGVCGKAAVYVQREDVDDIVEQVVRVLDDRDYSTEIVASGRVALARHPSIGERIRQELDFLHLIHAENRNADIVMGQQGG